MMKSKEVYFRVAEQYFRIFFADRANATSLLCGYGPFYVEKEEAEGEHLTFDMIVEKDLVDIAPEGEKVGDFDVVGSMYHVWKLSSGGYKIIIDFFNHKASAAFRTTADFSFTELSVMGDFTSEQFGLNNAIMVIFAFSCASKDILLMHSSVVVNKKKGYMFLGQSGTGKSTHSDLWCKYIDGSEILNDDNPVIRIKDEEAWVYGSPWSGKRDYYKQLGFPIGGIVQLEQAPENKICHLSKVEAFARIMSSCSTMIWDIDIFNMICDTANKLVAKVPMYFLRNQPIREAAVLSASHCMSEEDNGKK